jgi:SAM-dependent methyltransferase
MLDRYQAIDPEKLDLAPDVRVLDVGCGTGRHLLELSKYPVLLAGLDTALDDLRVMRFMFQLTEKERPIAAKVHIIQGDGERLPFPDASFDRVICTETLEHVPDDRAIMCELMRVLRPGGVLAISVPDEYSERLLWRISPSYRTQPGGHVRIYRRKQIRELLRASGAEPFAVQYRHSLETVRWVVHSVVDREWGKPGIISRGIRWLLDRPSHRHWRLLKWTDYFGSYVLPKSIVLYGRKLERQPR